MNELIERIAKSLERTAVVILPSRTPKATRNALYKAIQRRGLEWTFATSADAVYVRAGRREHKPQKLSQRGAKVKR